MWLLAFSMMTFGGMEGRGNDPSGAFVLALPRPPRVLAQDPGRKMKIDPTLVSVQRRTTPHGTLYDVSYNGVLLDGHALRAFDERPDLIWATAAGRLQRWLDGASAHERVEFFRKTRANQAEGTHIQSEGKGIRPDDRMCQK